MLSNVNAGSQLCFTYFKLCESVSDVETRFRSGIVNRESGLNLHAAELVG